MKDFFRHPVIGIDRILSSGIKWQLLFLLGVIVAAILLFIVIEWLTGSILTIKENDPRNIFVDVYYHFADPGNQYVVEGTWNRFLAFLISITGSALMGGLLISIFSNIIDRRVERAREGQIGYKFRNHYVIIGFDKMAIGLIKQLYQKSVAEQSDHTPYLFVIQTSGSVDSARHELLSKLDASIDRRTIILHGGRDSREDLEKLYLPDCKEIFLLGEENETDHDSINIECAALINRILREKNAIGKEPRDIEELRMLVAQIQSRCKKCNVLFEAQSTFAVFQRYDIESIFQLPKKTERQWLVHFQKKYKDGAENEKLLKLTQPFDRLSERLIDFLPFNFYETWAEKVLVRGLYTPHDKGSEVIRYVPIDGDGIGYDSNRYVHLVIVGMTSMGIAMGVKAAHIAHYPNFLRDRSKRTRISFIDMNADTEFDRLRGRYDSLFDMCDYRVIDTVEPAKSYANPNTDDKFTDIEFEFIKGSVESRPIQELLQHWAEEEDGRLLTIAICFEIPQKSIATALYMPRLVYEKAHSILVRQNVSCSTIELIRKAHQYGKLRAFGMLDECYDIDDDCMKRVRRINFIYHKITPEQPFPQTLDDIEARALWEELSTVHRWSNVYNAHSVPSKRRSFGKSEPENLDEDTALIEMMAEVEHNRWNMEKLIMGYRPTTPGEDEEIQRLGKERKRKIERESFAHTYIKPYEALSESVRDYDRLIMKYLWRV